MYSILALLAKKNDGESWSMIIFVIIAIIVSLIGYIKKKIAESGQTTYNAPEEEDPSEVFNQYLSEDEEEAEVRPHIVVDPYSEQQRTGGRRSRRGRGRNQEQYEFEAGTEPSVTTGVTHRLVADAEMPEFDESGYAATSVAMAEPVDLMKALPDGLTPNQKAIVLMEILSSPKGLEGI